MTEFEGAVAKHEALSKPIPPSQSEDPPQDASQRQVVMTLRKSEPKPDFLKLYPGFFYKFSLKNFRNDVAQGRLTKIEAKEFLGKLH